MGSNWSKKHRQSDLLSELGDFMCGICGELRFEPKPTTANWPKLIEMMHRRGPDDKGHWTDNQHCTLGFRRLAILDLSPAGYQPMCTPEGRFVLVYNGELYNFRELRSQLEKKGVRFRSTGDTEVVLQALAEWGEDALTKFNGMFALGFYDKQEKRLLLARDHAGIKPLYYMHTDEGVMFASQYDQILAHPWSHSLQVSEKALVSYLQRLYIPAPDAILEHTHMLKPGTWIMFDASGNIRQGCYYEFPKYQPPTLFGEEAYEAVDAAISNAVRRQLISDVPVGTFLSGGIDSPLVTAKVQAITGGGYPAFTIGTNGHSSDESEDAVYYAEQLGVEHVLRQITEESALDMLNAVVDASGEPFADYSIFPTMLVARLARQKVTVALSGDGGDEPFWGYTRSFGPIKQATVFHFPYWFRRGEWSLRQAIHRRIPGRAKWSTVGEWYREILSYFSREQINKVFPNLSPKSELHPHFRFSGWRQDETSQWVRWLEFTEYLPEVLLKVDRASMYHSLEVRVPLLDKEVLDIASRVDWRTCVDLKQWVGKKPLRQALSHHIPRQTIKKRGFTVPMEEWLRGPLRDTFNNVVLNRSEILGFQVDTDAIHQMYEFHVQGRCNYKLHLWGLLSLALWEQRHLRGR